MLDKKIYCLKTIFKILKYTVLVSITGGIMMAGYFYLSKPKYEENDPRWLKITNSPNFSKGKFRNQKEVNTISAKSIYGSLKKNDIWR